MASDLQSPHWSTMTKIFVTVSALVLLAIAVWRFQELITTLILAGMIAYFLNPVIVWLDDRTPLSRGAAIAVVYPLFALIVLGLLIIAGFTLYNQAFGLVGVVQEILLIEPERLSAMLDQPLEIGAWKIDPNDLDFEIEQLIEQLFGWSQFLIGQSAMFIRLAASTTLSWVGWLILIFVLSIYFAIDLPRFRLHISQAISQPGYRRDIEKLLYESGRIWNAYLRGQTTLALIVGLIFTLIFYLLGVRYALTLGVMAFFLDFFPYAGPTLMVLSATLVAMLQGENWLGLSPLWFGALVFAVGVIIQQIEGIWLNPRIMGGALGLHPLLVIVGAIMGGTLAGVLGVMLAAPTLATMKLLGVYVWRKMFDLDPFPEPAKKTVREENAVGQTPVAPKQT